MEIFRRSILKVTEIFVSYSIPFSVRITCKVNAGKPKKKKNICDTQIPTRKGPKKKYVCFFKKINI